MSAKPAILTQPRVDAQRLRALLVGADAGQRQAEAAAPHDDRGGHRGDRDRQHREVDRVALGHHRQHAAHRAGDLLLEVGDRRGGSARSCRRSAPRSRCRAGAAPAAPMTTATRGRDRRAEQRSPAARAASPSVSALRVGADAEERRGRERQVARGAAEQRPARRQRHVHQAGQRQRDDELAGDRTAAPAPSRRAPNSTSQVARSGRAFIA